jgi:hypothetical protein
MKLNPITPPTSHPAPPAASQSAPQPLGALPLTAAHLLIHAEIGEARQPGNSALQTALNGLRFRYIGRHRRASSIPLQLQVDDLQGQRMSAVADAGSLTDLPLPPGTYQITVRLGNYRRRYTMTLEPGTSFHLHLRFGTAGH